MKPCVKNRSRFNPETPAAKGMSSQGPSASMFKVWLSLSLLCRFDDRRWTRQARRVQKNSGERELSAASCRVCFDFWVQRARGCVSGVNSGPRFVTHEDSRARNNWRDPTERLGGPAVNAGRMSTDRPSA